jgi:hypothetical protein
VPVKKERAQVLLKSAADLEGLLAVAAFVECAVRRAAARIAAGERRRRRPETTARGRAASALRLSPAAAPLVPTPLERNVTQEIEGLRSLDPEAAEACSRRRDARARLTSRCRTSDLCCARSGLAGADHRRCGGIAELASSR